MKNSNKELITKKLTKVFKVLSILLLTTDLLSSLADYSYCLISSSNPLTKELFQIFKIGLVCILYCTFIVFIQKKNKKMLIFLLILYLVAGVLEFLFIIISFASPIPYRKTPGEIVIIIAQNVCRICCNVFLYLYVIYIKKEEELLTYKLHEDFINTLGYTVNKNKNTKMESSSLVSDPLFPNGDNFSNKNSPFAFNGVIDKANDYIR